MAPLLRIEEAVCVGCGVCIDSCPTDVLRLRGDPARAVAAYPEDCQGCFLCVFDCPVEAITLRQERLPLEVVGSGWAASGA